MDQRDLETRTAADSEPTNWMALVAGLAGLVLIIGVFVYISATVDDRASAPASTQTSRAPVPSTTGQAAGSAVIRAAPGLSAG